MTRRVPFVDRSTGEELVERDGALVGVRSGSVVAPIVRGIPRFVTTHDDYVESFGFQWNRWRDTLSDARAGTDAKRDLLLERSHLADYDLEGSVLLECGMGGGDDTEVLLGLPFGEVHSFDLSTAVDRAGQVLDDDRLVLSQASIFAIPYAPGTFDVVVCHRVLQHTPDPSGALRAVCEMVRPGGVLFVHSYKRSWRYLMNYKYKYRWLTKRVPRPLLIRYLDRWGPALHQLNSRARARDSKVLNALLYNFVPFEWIGGYGDATPEELLEIAKLCTFDALAPAFDKPMSTRRFVETIRAQGFTIHHLDDPAFSPLLCTASRDSGAG